MRRAGPMVGLAIVAAAVVPATAAAQWGPSEGVTSTRINARFPDVAINARGDAIAAWIATGSSGRSLIKASVRPAGGNWEPPRTLSRGGRSARDPQVAINDGGQIVAAWRRVARTRRVRTQSGVKPQAVYVVQARRRTTESSTWGPTSDISSQRQKSGAPRAGIDEKGRAVVVWHWGTGTTPGSPGFVSRVQAAVAAPGRAFGGVQRLSRRGGCGQAVGLPDIAVGAGGEAISWWECRRNRRDVLVDYATIDAGSARFGANRRLPGVSRGAPAVDATVARNGSILLATSRNDGSARGPRVLFALRGSAAGALSTGPQRGPGWGRSGRRHAGRRRRRDVGRTNRLRRATHAGPGRVTRTRGDELRAQRAPSSPPEGRCHARDAVG